MYSSVGQHDVNITVALIYSSHKCASTYYITEDDPNSRAPNGSANEPVGARDVALVVEEK